MTYDKRTMRSVPNFIDALRNKVDVLNVRTVMFRQIQNELKKAQLNNGNHFSSYVGFYYISDIAEEPKIVQ